MTKKNFCALPFHHIQIQTDGSFGVCCQHRPSGEHKKNIRNTTPQQWFHGEYLQEVRQSFIEDRRHPGCSACWQDEDSNITSMRHRTQQEYQILGVDTDRPTIKNIELQLSNLCNLTCLMCSEVYSSAIQAENRRLGISKIDAAEMKWEESSYQNLSVMLDQGFLVLNVLGGEPFYNKTLLDILEKLDPEKISKSVLQIITNATFYNDRWRSVMSKFSFVRLMVSLDGVGEVYEYIRHPAQWSQVEKNIDLIRGLAKTKIMINCTVQNLNILYLDQLIEWCERRDLFLQLRLLSQPPYLHITNLPSDVRHRAIDNLSRWIERYHTPHIKSALVSFRDLLHTDTMQQPIWEQFKTMIGMRDQIRNNSWRSILPVTENTSI